MRYVFTLAASVEFDADDDDDADEKAVKIEEALRRRGLSVSTRTIHGTLTNLAMTSPPEVSGA